MRYLYQILLNDIIFKNKKHKNHLTRFFSGFAPQSARIAAEMGAAHDRPISRRQNSQFYELLARRLGLYRNSTQKSTGSHRLAKFEELEDLRETGDGLQHHGEGI